MNEPASSSSSPIAARVAATSAVALIVIALHAIKPELEPSWRFVSEYATGRHGWIMKVAFVLWAVSCAALSVGSSTRCEHVPGESASMS